MRYSLWALARNALNYHQNWQAAWRNPPPRAQYDFVIIGGGGHGLATAYYLAKEHKTASIAVLEKGWLGGGNTGRNTTIVRSNYLLPPSARLYDHSVALWHNLSAELNFNVMFSPRGLLHLAHNISDMREIARRGHSNYVNGVDAGMLSPQQVREMVPFINLQCRYPVLGALLQKRGGIARHDAVAWGFARAADALGVDIIQNCEVNGFDIRDNKVADVRTTRGRIKVGKRVGAVPSGHCGVIAAMAGFRLPVETVPLMQAFVLRTAGLRANAHNISWMLRAINGPMAGVIGATQHKEKTMTYTAQTTLTENAVAVESQSAIGNRQSAIGNRHRQSAIGNRQYPSCA